MASQRIPPKHTPPAARKERFSEDAMKEDYRRMRGLMAIMIYLEDHPKRDALLKAFCQKALPKMQTRVGIEFIKTYMENKP